MSMKKLKMCRICLVEDVKMHLIGQTHLQNLYEALTMIPFETEDSRPICVCYICCAGLQNCHRLREMSLRSEELFTQMLNENMFQLQANSGRQRLTLKHPVIELSTGGVPLPLHYEVKIEPEDCEDDVPYEATEGLVEDDFMQSSPEGLSVEVIKKELEDDSSLIVAEELTAAEQRSFEGMTTREHNNKRTGTCKKPYQCDVCKENFKDKKKLSEHIICKHLDKKPYECDICNKYFSQKSSLDRHNDIHFCAKPYQCNLCLKRFMRKDFLEKHSRVHDNKKSFQCVICKTYFERKTTLYEHIREHSDKKLYECNLCEKWFNHKGNFSRHLRIHKGDKPYQCKVCKKCFSRSSHMYNHMRVHTGEKPFKCDICETCFNTENNLNLHIIHQHSAVKRFKCDVCNRCFNHRGNYHVHIRSHSGEKPYQCDVCNRRYSHKCNLKKHYGTHTG